MPLQCINLQRGKSLNKFHYTAILALADGTVFYGKSLGVCGQTTGEVVFNTAMTGYQEILSDPSYAQQLIALTYPHIGNVGVNDQDMECDTLHSAGLIVRDAAIATSSWRAQYSLTNFLQRHNMVAIADIDTRKLTRIVRAKGAQKACIISTQNSHELNAEKAIEQAKNYHGLNDCDLAQVVSTQNTYEWSQGAEWHLSQQDYVTAPDSQYHVVVYDFGVKKNILRKLSQRRCRLTVVNAKTPAETVLAMYPDGVFLSNGPGDPAPCDYAIAATKTLLEAGVPIFGICLGMQILSLAVGANTLKMKFGHHGANHPVEDIRNKRVYITSQNHSFAVDEKCLPNHVSITHRSLFDGSLQGIELIDRRAFAFQGHPEASPGPQDIDDLFDHFIELMQQPRA